MGLKEGSVPFISHLYLGRSLVLEQGRWFAYYKTSGAVACFKVSRHSD